MKFDEEYWVKLYTKDTTNWLALSYDAKSLLMHLFRKASRKTGEIDLGRLGARGVALILGHPDLWESRFEKPLQELVLMECITIEGSVLTVVNFPEAQTRSGTQRSRKSRERARAGESAQPEDPDLFGEVSQRDATQGNDLQRAATPGNEEQRKEKSARGAHVRGTSVDEDVVQEVEKPWQATVDLWFKKYEAKYGTKPAPKEWHFGVLSRLQKKHGYAELAKRIDLLFDDPPRFLASHAPDVPTLEQHWDKLLPTNNKKLTGAQIRVLSRIPDADEQS